MRRAVLLTLGLLELALGAAFVSFAFRLPSDEHLRESFGRFARVSTGAEHQVQALRAQMSELRRPELIEAAEQIGPRTEYLTDLARRQRLDFDTLAAMRDGLGQVASGMTTWADSLDTDRIQGMAEALARTADYIDRGVVPSAKLAAEGLRESADALAKDSERLGELLRQSPVDLKPLREVHDSLAGFETSFARVTPALKLERLGDIRKGFAGIETALSRTADQVDRFAGYSYPVVTFNGFKPQVDQKAFWPMGDDVARGLRDTLKGFEAANAELTALDEQMPELRKSLDESKRVVTATRSAMGSALENEEEVSRLMRGTPERTAAFAEQLPKVGRAFTTLLERTEMLADVAASLRMAALGLEMSLEQWPKARQSLAESAKVIEATRTRFDTLLERRDDYDRAMEQSTELANRLAEITPAMARQLDARMVEQDAALGRLAGGLSEVNAALPETESRAAGLLGSVRWLVWLVAALVVLHGLYVTSDALQRDRIRHRRARHVTAAPRPGSTP